MFELKWSHDEDGTLVTRRRKVGAHISRNEEGGFDWVIGIYPDKVFPWLLYETDSGQTDTEEDAVELVTELIVSGLRISSGLKYFHTHNHTFALARLSPVRCSSGWPATLPHSPMDFSTMHFNEAISYATPENIDADADGMEPIDRWITMAVGAPYPYPIMSTEGASAQFLAKGLGMLQICLPDIQRSEKQAICKGPVKAGLINDGPLLLWVFKFKGNLILECPFDSRLIPSQQLDLPSIGSDQSRLMVPIHLIDTTTNTLRALRTVTLPPALTLEFLSAVQDQLADKRSMAPYLEMYLRLPIERLAALPRLHNCGT